MAIISEQTYLGDGTQRSFQVVGTILSDSHIGVWLVDGAVETRLSTSQYDILGSVVLLNEAPASGISIRLLLSDSGEDLDVPPSAISGVFANLDAILAVEANEANINLAVENEANITTVATNIASVNSVAAIDADVTAVATNSSNISTVATNIADVNTVATNIADIGYVVETVVPNITEILQADDNATTATAKATEAQLRAWEAEAEKMTADSYATEPEDVFVKVYTSNGDGTFTATNTTEYSALHWSAKAGSTSYLIIDDGIPSESKVYSSTKTQALHDAQAVAIANLSGASASFYNNTATVIPEAPSAFVDLTWTNGQASTNTDIFELGTNEISFKADGNYNFLNTLTYYRLSGGSVMDVTFELYDADTSTVLATYTQTIDMIAGTKESVPMNSLLTISGASIADPIRMKVRMQATSASGTLELFSFNSILAMATTVQGALNVDATPTDGSNNPVASNGVFDALALKADSSSLSSYLAKAGGTMTGAITALRETKVAMVANDIDLSAGNLFTKTISGSTTLTVSNWLASGNVNSFILELTNGGSAANTAITWFSGVKWAGGTAPTLTASGVDILGFYSHDGGTTVRGIVLAKDSK